MKRVFLLIVLLSLGFLSVSQDVIITKNGEQIKSKIIEITADQIKYKEFDNLNGQTLVVNKSDVVRVNFHNGTSDEFADFVENTDEPLNDTLLYYNDFWGLSVQKNGKNLSGKEIREVYKNDAEALKLFNTGKTLNVIGSIIAFPSAFIFGYELGFSLAGGDANSGVLIIGGAGLITGLILNISGDSNIKKSVRIYNSKMAHSNSCNIKLGLSNNGIGICLNF